MTQTEDAGAPPPVPPPYQQWSPHADFGYGYPAPPPPPSRAWYKKKRFVIPGALLAVGVVFGGTGSDSDPAITASQATVAAPAPLPGYDAEAATKAAQQRAEERRRKAEQSAAQRKQEEAAAKAALAAAAEPARFPVGYKTTITEGAVEVGNLTVEDVTRSSVPTGKYAKYADGPEYGEFTVVTLRAEGLDNGWSINPYEFYLRGSDGTRYEPNGGNVIMGMDLDRSFDGGSINAGEQVVGTIAFDAAPGSAELVYDPTDFNDDGPLGIFELNNQA